MRDEMATQGSVLLRCVHLAFNAFFNVLEDIALILRLINRVLESFAT